MIRSEVEAENVLLALENPEITELFWNQQRVISPVEGYYTDHQIRTRKLGRLQKGENLLEARISYHSKVNIENMYLLGDFGVAVTGSRVMITAPVKELAFGDICGQGLAFYGGNLVYRMEIEVPEEADLVIRTTKFRYPLIQVSLKKDEECTVRKIFKSPYEAVFKNVHKGKLYSGVSCIW